MIETGERVARFVSDRLGFGLCPPYTAMGIQRGGEVVAGVIFNHFEGCDIRVTAAGTGWTRGFIQAVGEYVFGQLGCERMTITTADPKVAGFAVRCGGAIEGRMRNHFGKGRDGLIAGILRDDWKYHKVTAQ